MTLNMKWFAICLPYRLHAALTNWRGDSSEPTCRRLRFRPDHTDVSSVEKENLADACQPLEGKFMRALPVFLLLLLLALTGSSAKRVAIVCEEESASPALDTCKAELKLRYLSSRLFIIDRPLGVGDAVDTLAGGARAIVIGAPVRGGYSELETMATGGSPILLYDQALDTRVGIYVGLDRRNAGELLRSAAMTADDPVDSNSF